jgi:hypothetical protein
MQDSHALLSVIRCTEFLIKNHVMERLGILWDCKKDLNQTLWEHLQFLFFREL